MKKTIQNLTLTTIIGLSSINYAHSGELINNIRSCIDDRVNNIELKQFELSSKEQEYLDSGFQWYNGGFNIEDRKKVINITSQPPTPNLISKLLEISNQSNSINNHIEKSVKECTKGYSKKQFQEEFKTKDEMKKFGKELKNIHYRFENSYKQGASAGILLGFYLNYNSQVIQQSKERKIPQRSKIILNYFQKPLSNYYLNMDVGNNFNKVMNNTEYNLNNIKPIINQ